MKSTVNQLSKILEDELIFVDKPLHWTSADVLNWIKKACRIKKCGHGGTLDPLASGLLVVGINNGTKKMYDLLLDTKEYIAKIAFGYETESGDNSSEIVNYNFQSRKPNIQSVINVLEKFKKGPYLQVAPKYSALKYNGKPLYYWARMGVDVPEKTREVKLFDYEILEYENNLLTLRVLVSKGFYVRSLAIDLGHELNGFATLVGLRRTKLGDYSLEQSYTLDELYQIFHENKPL